MGAFGIAARCNATSSSAVSEAASAATSCLHTVPRNEPVVSAEWLHANLRDPDVKVLATGAFVCLLRVVCNSVSVGSRD
jgi:thiosulfate/3-mercaptopyruvate sulfurtransferase